jgi:hypothetical protein
MAAKGNQAAGNNKMSSTEIIAAGRKCHARGVEAMNHSEIMIYQDQQGKIKIDVRLEDEAVWLTQEHMAQRFGIGKSTATAKTKNVRDALNSTPLDPRLTLPSKLHDNPLVWIVLVDGFMVDIRKAPLEVQKEACRLSQISFVPAGKV